MTTHLPRTAARALASLVLVTALLIGVPWVLVRISTARFGGAAPWSGIDPPGRWSLDQLGDALSSRLTDSLISDVLIRSSLATVWLAAAVLVTTLGAEVIHQVRHDGIGLPAVRGLGWGQPLARFIATGLLVVTPMFGSRVSAAPSLPVREVAVTTTIGGEAAHAARPDLSDVRRTSAVLASTPSGATSDQVTSSYVVAPGDSVYAIAERLAARDRTATVALADQILDLNLGSVMPDGQRFTNAAYIEPGWVLELPVVATSDPPEISAFRHVVSPGDTLSGIATDHLGDPHRWPEVWDANAGREMSDGRTFDDPHLILPGWQLEVTAANGVVSVDDEVVEVEHVAEVDDVVEVDEVENLVDPPASSATDPTVALPPPPSISVASPSSAPSTTSSTSTTSTSTTSTTSAPGMFEDPGSDTDQPARPASPAPIGLGQAAMMSAGLITLIAALRGRRLRAARPGARVPEPRPESVATERTLRAVDTADVGERLLRVDLALRCAAAEVADRDRQVLAALVGGDGSVELVLSGPCDLPEPWLGRAERWTLPADVAMETLAVTARSVGAPCLALVHVGVTVDGRDVHLDLEAVGLLSVDAPSARADEVVAGIAATLGTSPFAEVARLIGVGVPVTAFVGHRHVDLVATADAAFALADHLVGSTRDLADSTFAVRSRMLGGEAWEPAVVLVGSDAAPQAPGLTVRPSRGVAAVVAGSAPTAGARLVLADDAWRLYIGAQTTPDLVLDLVPIGLTTDELVEMHELITDVSTSLGVDEQLFRAVSTPPAIMTFPERDPEPAHEPEQSDGESVPEAPSWSIMVKVLGPVDVMDAEGTAIAFEKSKARELIAWLATHRDRSTRTGARTALWDLDVRDVTFANVVSAARRTIARLVPPPDGVEWLARTQTEQLALHSEVISDAEVLADRLQAARGRSSATAVEILEPAVDLIRGMPFEGTSYLWPDADGLSSNLVLLATTAAAELAAHHLGVGDVEGVFRATGRGLLALPGHEELIALRMRAHACVGDHAGIRHEWESYERVVTSDPWSDGEPAPKLVELRRELLSPSA
ncbi:BTAD domain-containing putative transcriptional regulator [soil metagenome]